METLNLKPGYLLAIGGRKPHDVLTGCRQGIPTTNSNEQRRKGIFKPTSLPSLHLPSGGLLVAGSQTSPRQNSCCPGPDKTCGQAASPQRVAVRYGVHPRTSRRSGMAGQIKRRTFVSLGRGKGQKEKQNTTSKLGHPNSIVDCTASITLPDNMEFRGHVVTFPGGKALEQRVCWGIQGKMGVILLSGASCSPLKNEHSMREWTRVYSIKPEQML